MLWVGAPVGLLAVAREIQQEHRERKSGIGAGNCVACREEWPCKPLRLAAPITEAFDE